MFRNATQLPLVAHRDTISGISDFNVNTVVLNGAILKTMDQETCESQAARVEKVQISGNGGGILSTAKRNFFLRHNL